MTTVSIRSDVRANPVSRTLAGEIEFVRCEYIDAVDHTGLCTLDVMPEASFLPVATEGNVLRIVEDDGHVLEYRISRVRQSIGAPLVGVTARPVIHDLSRVFLWASTGGIPSFTLGASNLSAGEWWTQFMEPALVASGIIYVTLGTVQLDRLMSFEWSLQPVMWMANQIIAGTDLDITYAIDDPGGAVERYRLGFERRNETVPGPRIIVGHNATVFDAETDIEPQANVLIPLGATPAGGLEPGNIGQYAARIVAVSGEAITLEDPDGNPAPVYAPDQITGQWLELLVPPILPGAQA